ncbi:MAG: limonene-1,2-epoxide hydrolase family protein [Acidobacteriota bacterium]|nr:limonene-1,2-epoxide hydrolase family protein [Acidobacteriota bacterium]
MNETEIVESFLSAFNDKDLERIMSFFAPNAVYHNMPSDPTEGIEAIRTVIAGYVGAASEIDWETLAIAQVGTTVLTERVDNFVFGTSKVALPVMGAFEVRDGKIVAWRDYFDIATWTKQMGN